MVQLLLGNIGVSGGGMNALRGHSNIQRLTDLGLMTQLLPGCINLPVDSEQTWDQFIAARALKPLRPNQLSSTQTMDMSVISLVKSWCGDAATAENHWA